MSYGLKVFNSSGQIAFDTSRLGGVALDSQLLTMVANTNYTFTYTIPSGRDVKVSLFPRNIAFRNDLISITKSIVGTNASITINPGAVDLTLFVVFILK